jgi:phenylpropionate dioxygenase-like ring-hydroxylating dioxygenase large terminal subunit
MEPQGHIDLLKRLLHYVETRTTSLADAPWSNDVSVYTDPQHLAREQQQLFRGHPLLVGFASEWAGPGAYRTDDRAGVPILLVRGSDRRLRAFLNVCRHRGAKVAKDCGEARAFSCPYHAWSYDLTGKLIAIPDERCFPGVRAERSSLTELPICEKYGLVWVIPTPDPDGANTFDIDPLLAGLGPELACYGFSSWVFYDKRMVPETMNWKLLVDTFHEGYHIGFLHRKSLGPILHGNVADFESFGPNHRLTFPRRKLERLKAEPEVGWDLMWNTTLIYFLFPNTILMLQGAHLPVREPRRSRRYGAFPLCSSRACHAGGTHSLGQEFAARARRRHGRGLSDRPHHPARPDFGRAGPYGLRPQRASDDPLSSVAPGRPRPSARWPSSRGGGVEPKQRIGDSLYG